MKLLSYKGIGDPNEHAKNVKDQLDYYHVNRDVKCKLFELTLIESILAWYKSLADRSIDLWYNFYESFIVPFTTRKR